MANEQVDLSILYKELQRQSQGEDYEAALKTAEKILNSAPDEKEAFHAKVVCLLQLNKFSQCITAIKKSEYASELVFEKAYSEYRLNQNEDAFKTLSSAANLDLRTKELKAQLLYRLERYEDALKIYKDVIKNSKDDWDEERHTNVSAVYAGLSMGRSQEQEVPEPEGTDENYEQAYNSACYLIGRGHFQSASEKLQEAEKLCSAALEEDEDMTDEERNDELAIIRVQLAYCAQRLGQVQDALSTYNSVLKQRPTFADVTAVAANNSVVLNRDQNVFDSKKKMKLATLPELASKLTNSQQTGIALNQCILSYYSNQVDTCRSQLSQLDKQLTPMDLPLLIEAALLVKSKQTSKAMALLQHNSGAQSLDVQLTLAQLQISQGQVAQACKTLISLENGQNYYPAIVSLLVSLYTLNDDKESVSKLYADAIDWHEKNSKKTSSSYSDLLMSSSEYHMKINSHQVAAEQLEKLRRLRPGDRSVLSMLFASYSQFNPVMAKEIGSELPSIESLADSLDVQQLENASQFASKYKLKKEERAQADEGGPIASEKKKKRKKRKGPLPKNYNPNVNPDPERWLPLRERSTWRHRRRDRHLNKDANIGKGSQGAAGGGPELDITKMESVADAAPTVQPQQPRNKGFQASKQQQKIKAKSRKRK